MLLDLTVFAPFFALLATFNYMKIVQKQASPFFVVKFMKVNNLSFPLPINRFGLKVKIHG